MQKRCANCKEEQIVFKGDAYVDSKLLAHFKKNRTRKRECRWAAEKTRDGIRWVCQMGPCPEGEHCEVWVGAKGKKRMVHCGCSAGKRKKPTKKK